MVFGRMQRELIKHLSPFFLQTLCYPFHRFFRKIFGKSRSRIREDLGDNMLGVIQAVSEGKGCP